MASGVGPYAAPAGSDPSSGLGSGLANLAIDYKNYLPEAGFWAYLQQLGMVDNTPQSQFAQRRMPNYYGQYQAEAADNPGMGFYDYLNKKGFDPTAEYNAQTPDQRFDFSSRNLTPRARWSVA